MIPDIIDVNEIFHSLFEPRTNRNKLYTVKVDGKIYKNMKLSFEIDKNNLESFHFEKSKK